MAERHQTTSALSEVPPSRPVQVSEGANAGELEVSGDHKPQVVSNPQVDFDGPQADMLAEAKVVSSVKDKVRSGTKNSGTKNTDVYAALDLGTNNCRLLIAEPGYQGFRVIDAFSRLVRLGEGLASSHRLTDTAMDRAIEALQICADKMQAKAVTRSRLIATEACRTADNRPEFVERVLKETGLVLEIVERKTEAVLAAAGCAALASNDAESVVLFDIGGGSTELVWLGAKQKNTPFSDRIREWDSLPLGVVNLSERYGGYHVDRIIFEKMVAEVLEHLIRFADLTKTASSGHGFHLLGTSGTVTTLAGVHLELERYDRRRIDGVWMKSSDVDAVMEMLLNFDFEQRVKSPCIGPERADLVLAGCAILEAIRRTFPTERLRVADRGLREGILMKLMRDDNVWYRGSL